MKKITLTLLALLCVTALSGQEYTLEVTNDKKVIYPARLGLQEDLPVSSVLCVFPELIYRGDVVFDKYDLQFDGKSVGESREVLLEQIRVGDIEKIEVSTSSVSTQKNNGKSGVINIVPSKKKEGFGGSAILDASTLWDVMPGVDLNYGTKKIDVRGFANFDYSNKNTSKLFQERFTGGSNIGENTFNNRHIQETARVNVNWNISDKDTFKAWMIEGWSRTRDTKFTRSVKSIEGQPPMEPGWTKNEFIRDTTVNVGDNFKINLMTEYEHVFYPESKINLSADYEMARSENAIVDIPRILNGELMYELPLWTRGNDRLKFKTGANTTYRTSVSKEFNGGSIYVSPLIEFNFKYKQLDILAAARYQYFRSRFSILDELPFEDDDHDVIANLNVLWQIKPHHALRFILSRDLERPTDKMRFPKMVYYPSSDEWVRGNPLLSRSYVHSFDANYIFDWQDKGHSIILNSCASYTRADGIITSSLGTTQSNDLDGKSIFYTKYANSGINDIVGADVSLIYQYGIFSLSFCGNVFCNFINDAGNRDFFTYYNLSLGHVFNFKRNWILSGIFLYNSPISRSSTINGDCFYAQLRLSKKIRNWTIHAELGDIFDYDTVDYEYTPGRQVSGEYDLYSRYVGLGVTYKFGNRK